VRALILPVGEDRYAVPTDRVREVATDLRATALPGAPSWVLGVVNLRGEVVPLLDTAAVLGLGATAAAPYAVVVELAAGPAALAADAMPAVDELGDALGPSDLPGAVGRHRVGGELVVALDPETLVATARGDVAGLAAW